MSQSIETINELLNNYEIFKDILFQNIKDYNKLNNYIIDNNLYNDIYINKIKKLYSTITFNIINLNNISNKLSKFNINNKDKIIDSWKEIIIISNKLKEEHNNFLIYYNDNKYKNDFSIELNYNSIKYSALILFNIIAIYFIVKYLM